MTKHKQNKPKDLTKNIMSEIKSGQVKMKPRLHFIAGSVLTGLGIASSLFTTLLIMTMTFFRLRRFGLVGLLWPGKPFFAPMPLLILMVSLIILWGGIKLLKRYDFSYKYNFLAIIITVITLVITLGFLFDRLGINQHLQKRPQLKRFYQQHQPGFPPNPSGHRPHRLY
jgi:hypothetical protein